MWALGWIAVPLWLGAGLAGFWERRSQGLPAAHVAIALLATLILLFAHSWVLFYSLGASRLSAETVSRESYDASLAGLPRYWLGSAAPWIGSACALALVVFAAGVAGFTSRLPLAFHVSGAALVLIVQIVALSRERRLLRRVEWLFRVLGEVR